MNKLQQTVTNKEVSDAVLNLTGRVESMPRASHVTAGLQPIPCSALWETLLETENRSVSIP